MDEKQLFLEAIKLDGGKPKRAFPYYDLANLLAAGERVTVFNGARAPGNTDGQKTALSRSH